MYWLLKQIIKIELFFYFKKIVVTGKEHLKTDGPLIVVANHPNTLMDPLIIAAIMKQRVGFLANAGIFKGSFISRILGLLHVIPVFRKQDISPNEKPDNVKTFIKCHEYLNEKGTLLIFPEGSSYHELKLRDIKTGTARIALSFEPHNDDENKLKILPITLDYSDAIQFRSMVAVTIGKPISLETYLNTYLESETEAVTALTERMGEELAQAIPHTTDKDQEQFLINGHKFYTTFKAPDSNLHTNPKGSFESRNQISKSLSSLIEANPALYKDTQQKVQRFFNALQKEKLTPGFFTDKFSKKNRNWVCLSYSLKLLILAPLYIIGLISNYIPYILPSKIFEILKLEIEYKTSIQIVVGLFTFPLFYWLQIKLLSNFVHIEPWLFNLLFITFAITGYLAMYYWTETKRFKRVLRYYFSLKQNEKINILKLRDEILKNIELATENL